MKNNLTSENERFIAGEITAGVYANRGEALDAAVESLKRRRQLLDRLSKSRHQLDSGDFVEYDEAGLAGLFEGLIAGGQAQMGTDSRDG
jgi:Arc/MetJ-type ribon-helix-helix transcriptional regulator